MLGHMLNIILYAMNAVALATGVTAEACDVCFQSLLGEVFLPFGDDIGLPADEIPNTPGELANGGLMEAFQSGLNGCAEDLTALFQGGGPGFQEAGGALLQCGSVSDEWGPLTTDKIREFRPDFLTPPTSE